MSTLLFDVPTASQATSSRPATTVVVPTRHESRTIGEVATRLSAALTAEPGGWELLVVDDSDDDTPDVARALGSRLPVRVHHRPRGSRQGGLAGAVLEGFDRAYGDVLVVMDGDLQHPPEVVAALVPLLAGGFADIAIASRYVPGASSGGLSGPHRRLVSTGCRTVVRTAFPGLRGVRDPLGGYFAVRRDVVSGRRFDPVGFKVLLEILVRGRWDRVVEVPYSFAPRTAGASKATLHEGMRFVRHVGRLRRNRQVVA